MLIRTQDKNRVICLDACHGISLQKIERVIPSVYKVYADLYGASRVELGIYENEKRAKEVLEEIVGCYSIHKTIEIGKRVSLKELQRYQGMMFGCYDMPAE